MKKLGAKIIAIIVLAGVVILLGMFAVGQWHHARTAAAESRVQSAQSTATIESAKDAIATQAQAQTREDASEGLTQSNEKEIRSAKGADAHVDPAANGAGIASLCRRASYRAEQRCLRKPPAP